MEMENIVMPMEKNISVNSKMGSNMERELILIRMVLSMRVIGKWERKTEKENYI